MFRLQRSSVTRPDSLATLRRQGFGLLAPLTALAAALALFFQRGHIDPLDRVALPLIAALMLLLELTLRRNWLRLEQALNVSYWVCAAYLLALFHHQFSSFVPVHHMLSEGVLWFPVLYMMAFIIWRTKKAVQVVGSLIALTLLIALVDLRPLWQAGELSDRLLASVSQFFVSGILIAVIQYVGASARRQYEEMRRLAFVDSLTGLPNRRAAQNMLDQLEAGQQPYAVVMFDLDLFKRVNDRFGHAEGDRVLAQTAQVTGQHLGPPNLLARWGGEEFLMVLPGVSADEAQRTAERARQQLASAQFGAVGQITATFGVAQRSVHSPLGNHEQVLEQADHALRQAKAGGRNCVRLADDLPEAAPHRAELRPGQLP